MRPWEARKEEKVRGVGQKQKSICGDSWAAIMCFIRGNLNCYEVLYLRLETIVLLIIYLLFHGGESRERFYFALNSKKVEM